MCTCIHTHINTQTHKQLWLWKYRKCQDVILIMWHFNVTKMESLQKPTLKFWWKKLPTWLCLLSEITNFAAFVERKLYYFPWILSYINTIRYRYCISFSIKHCRHLIQEIWKSYFVLLRVMLLEDLLGSDSLNCAEQLIRISKSPVKEETILF